MKLWMIASDLEARALSLRIQSMESITGEYVGDGLSGPQNRHYEPSVVHDSSSPTRIWNSFVETISVTRREELAVIHAVMDQVPGYGPEPCARIKLAKQLHASAAFTSCPNFPCNAKRLNVFVEML